MTSVCREARCPPGTAPVSALVLALSHLQLEQNAGRYVFNHSLDAVRAHAGADAWGDTDIHLELLRESLRSVH